MNTGARVTYAMGKDKELGSGLGSLHVKNQSPHRAIWMLATISAIVGCVAVLVAFGDGGAPTDAAIAAIPHGLLSSFGYTTHAKMAALPNTLLTVTLASNFGTFILYGLSCILCLMAYHGHPQFVFWKHVAVPVLGLLANFGCMCAYIVFPFIGIGTKMEPLLALGIAAVWAVYGGYYFITAGKAEGKSHVLQQRHTVR
jgi:amino acid transporter